MRRKDRRSPERSRGNRGVAELRAEALGTGPMGRDIQDLGYELPRIPIPRTRVNFPTRRKNLSWTLPVDGKTASFEANFCCRTRFLMPRR